MPYDGIVPCSECGIDNRDGRTVCGAYRQAAVRAAQKAADDE